MLKKLLKPPAGEKVIASWDIQILAGQIAGINGTEISGLSFAIQIQQIDFGRFISVLQFIVFE
jgi:hypothetical protein